MTTTPYQALSLGDLLDHQLELQLKLGHSFSKMSATEVGQYVSTMALAMTDELHELMRETPWKPWATYPDDVTVNRERYVSELVDCLHFLLNLALVMNVTAEDLSRGFEAKNQENATRYDTAYDGHWADH